MTEKKEDKPAQKKDYEAIVRERVENRSISLRDVLYESADKPNSDKKVRERARLSEVVTKADDAKKEE